METTGPPSDAVVGDEARRRAEAIVEKEEGAARRLSGRADLLVTAGAVAMSLFHLYTAWAIVPAQILRAAHVGFVLALVFLVFPAARRFRDRIRWWDVGLSLLGISTI